MRFSGRKPGTPQRNEKRGGSQRPCLSPHPRRPSSTRVTAHRRGLNTARSISFILGNKRPSECARLTPPPRHRSRHGRCFARSSTFSRWRACPRTACMTPSPPAQQAHQPRPLTGCVPSPPCSGAATAPVTQCQECAHRVGKERAFATVIHGLGSSVPFFGPTTDPRRSRNDTLSSEPACRSPHRRSNRPCVRRNEL